LILKNDGTLWSVGYSDLEGLDETQWAYPQKIMEQVEIVATSSHTLVMKRDGTLLGWGNNYNGQLGNGTTSDYLTNVGMPVQIDYSFAPAETYRSSWTLFVDDEMDPRSTMGYFVSHNAVYFGLHDVAKALSGSSLQYDVAIDQEQKKVTIRVGEAWNAAAAYYTAPNDTGMTALKQVRYTVSTGDNELQIRCYEADGTVIMDIRDILDLIGGKLITPVWTDGMSFCRIGKK
jgi:hypothetical protein